MKLVCFIIERNSAIVFGIVCAVLLFEYSITTFGCKWKWAELIID